MKQLLIVIITLLVLGGGAYWWLSQAKEKEQTTPVVKEKVGTTTKTGVLSESAGRFYLQEAGQTPKEIDSYTVELDAYVGQNVTVSGQYSGDTLFVGSIQ
jgi:uncharacterized protein YxeA